MAGSDVLSRSAAHLRKASAALQNFESVSGARTAPSGVLPADSRVFIGLSPERFPVFFNSGVSYVALLRTAGFVDLDSRAREGSWRLEAPGPAVLDQGLGAH